MGLPQIIPDDVYPNNLGGELVPSAVLCANFALVGGICAADTMSVTLGTWLADLIIWIENPAGNISRLLQGNASDIGFPGVNAVRPFEGDLAALAMETGQEIGMVGILGPSQSEPSCCLSGPSCNTISGARPCPPHQR